MCVVLKMFLKRGQCGGNLCNDPCWDVYKGVCLLKRFSMFLKVCFESVLMCVLKNGKCFCKFDQVTKSGLPLNLLKDFSMFF